MLWGTIGRTEFTGFLEIGAPDEDTAVAFPARPRRAVRGRSLVVVVSAILHPLPNVADHVVEAECIGGEFADRGRLFFVVKAKT